MNYLEQLVSEWYQYKGYFVKTNVHPEKSRKEIDILALNVGKKRFVHIEITSDDFRPKSKKVYQEKFNIAGIEYSKNFDGYKQLPTLEKEYVFMSVSPTDKKEAQSMKGIIVHSVADYIEWIQKTLEDTSLKNHRVSEAFPLIKTLQLFIKKDELHKCSFFPLKTTK